MKKTKKDELNDTLTTPHTDTYTHTHAHIQNYRREQITTTTTNIFID